MPKYECEDCCFISENKKDYNRHLKSKKHQTHQCNNELQYIDDINNNICIYCKKSFNAYRYLSKHLKNYIIKNHQDNDYIKTIHQLTEELNICKNDVKHYKEQSQQYKEHNLQYKDQNNQYKTENEYYKMLLENAGGMLKKSVSSLSYIINNYKNAPVLKPLIIKDIDNEDMKDNEKFIKYIILYHNNKTLYRYLGDIIIQVCKKQDPNELTPISLRSAHYIRI